VNVQRPTLRNIGPRSAAWLAEVGVHTLADLRRVGVLETWQRCALAGHPVSLNLAYALEGACRDCDWRDLPAAVRTRLAADLRRAEAEDHATPLPVHPRRRATQRKPAGQ
jgi:DNA transformation protein and related proteins